MTTEERTELLKQRVENLNQVREHVLSGDFLLDLLETYLPNVNNSSVFQIKVAIQKQLESLQREEDLIAAEAEEVKTEIAKEIEVAAKDGTPYPTYSDWKTSVRRTYSYNEAEIKEAVRAANIPEDRLYKVTKKFDPSALLKTGIPEDLKETIRANKIVAKHTAVVKWTNEG